MKTLYNPDIARVIDEAMRQQGITKFKLTVLSGLSPSTVSYACRGFATPTTMARIARVLGLSAKQLRGNKAVER